ncbi:hypothetical protein Lal_00022511 [Lupinus albus]|nr:hypothetical protein Lal_00022511 [Lupinus albus]
MKIQISNSKAVCRVGKEENVTSVCMQFSDLDIQHQGLILDSIMGWDVTNLKRGADQIKPSIFQDSNS